jgi:uncharacterized integral membrane protein (TIGR00697 family)
VSEPRGTAAYRYVDLITASFVAVLLISNIAAIKAFRVAGLTFDGGAFIFPVSYIFGDILTEVYGYRRSRRVIWTGFVWLIIMNAVIALTVAMPPDPSWNQDIGDEAFRRVMGLSPRLAAAGILGYFWGEFSNSYVLAKMKIWTEGRLLWARTIGSTVVGELVDTALFCTIAFWGILPGGTIVNYTLTGYVYKTAVEIVMTPVTYAVIAFLKREEHEDVYDRETDFNPFHLGA